MSINSCPPLRSLVGWYFSIPRCQVYKWCESTTCFFSLSTYQVESPDPSIIYQQTIQPITMLSFNTNSCLLALAALPCLLQGQYTWRQVCVRLIPTVTLATPSGVRARNSEETLFRAGGTSLDDIAVPKSVADGRCESHPQHICRKL
jgi:hypothetical protein